MFLLLYFQTHVNWFQAHISQLEHSHAQRLLEVTARHHQELDMETDRLALFTNGG